LTKDDIDVSRGVDCTVIKLNVRPDTQYSVTVTDDADLGRAIDLLMEYILYKEVGITATDVIIKCHEV
jgi:hypothetical protein